MKGLFKRADSQHWHLRLVTPADMTTEGKRKVVERSLGTADRQAAELVALRRYGREIEAHKATMHARRQARVVSIMRGPWEPEYPPGLFTTPDGRTGIATLTDLTFADGTRQPNGGPAISIEAPRMVRGEPVWSELAGKFVRPLSPDTGLTAAETFAALDAAWGPGDEAIDAATYKPRVEPVERSKLVPAKPAAAKPVPPALAEPSSDDALLETYLAHGSIKKGCAPTAAQAKEARKIWATFKRVVGKPLAECKIDDGRALVQHLETETPGIKAATLRRYLVPLIAVVNLALTEGKLTGRNPFVGCVTNRDTNKSEERDAISDADMELIRQNIHKLRDSDQLYLRLVACTGVRRNEAFQIASERKEDGIRFCIVSSRKGDKGDLHYRRIPFPAEVLPYLPAKISGPLFTGHAGDTVKRITKFLSDISVICDDGRNIAASHSFRHRAKIRLRATCPDDELRDAIGGWESGGKNKGRKYGTKASEGYKGYSMAALKTAIDGIGF